MTTHNDITAPYLHRDAQELGSHFPALLVEAQKLAASILIGVHGRRRAGVGEDFWQFRTAYPDDAQKNIDWRRSGRSDVQYVRQNEWQTTHAVYFWADSSRSMQFVGDEGKTTKAIRAKVLCLASAILLNQGGERIGLMNQSEPAKHGENQLLKMAALMANSPTNIEYGIPPESKLPQSHCRVYVSDFFGEWDDISQALYRAADQNASGYLLQVLDSSEIDFPFKGPNLFESMTGGLHYESKQASALQQEYQKRLRDRQEKLTHLAHQTGWHYYCHPTNQAAHSALLWIYRALKGRG